MAQSHGSNGADQQQTAAVVWLIVALVIGIVLYLSYFFSSQGKKKKEKKTPVPARPNEASQGPAVVGPSGRRRGPRMRVQRRDEPEPDDNFGDFGGESDNEVIDASGEGGGKIGAKKRAKMIAKAEKKAEREALEEERAERKKQDALLEKEREKDAKQREAEELAKEEELRLLKEKKEKEEYEEYLKLKESFIIEESGEIGVLSEEESQALLQEFIDFIKGAKVVQLEDLALKFNLKTQEVIERLENLQEAGRITGVMDDRGKFIFISEEELKAVAKFIKQRGRISIAELAESSNTLITLQEKENSKSVVQASA